ncbi:MAG TPA: hypothetical protein VLT59_07790, partial [Steroidobacteraceae bacterium]|nr:hypothetical protein [Steroidobacteraceae bacterium]
KRRNSWPEVKGFARNIAEGVARAAPRRYIATASKARRKGKVFIDWLRNERGATAVVPFAARAREGAPVAVPVTWQELARIDSAAAYDVHTVRRRLAALKKDPWAGYFEVNQSLTRAMLERAEAVVAR